MSASEITVSLEQIAAISERAYRRGFQQGHHAGQAGVSVRDLAEWRHSLPIDYAIVPEDGPSSFGDCETSIDRLLIEENWLSI